MDGSAEPSLATYRVFQTVDLEQTRSEAERIFSSAAAAAQMGEMLVAGLLQVQPHSQRQTPLAPVSSAAPRYVKRAEDFMTAEIDRPITIGDLVAVTGVSARTLHQGFRRFRETTPMAALRRLRLDRVRTALQAREPGQNVTSIALEWGFGHLGRFSIDYFKRFHEYPSQTLRGNGVKLRQAP